MGCSTNGSVPSLVHLRAWCYEFRRFMPSFAQKTVVDLKMENAYVENTLIGTWSQEWECVASGQFLISIITWRSWVGYQNTRSLFYPCGKTGPKKNMLISQSEHRPNIWWKINKSTRPWAMGNRITSRTCCVPVGIRENVKRTYDVVDNRGDILGVVVGLWLLTNITWLMLLVVVGHVWIKFHRRLKVEILKDL